MPTDIFRALLADIISTMTTEELRNIIMNTPDKDLEAVGAAVLAEKRKTNQAVHPGVEVLVGAMEEEREEEGGPVTKIAKKPKTVKKKAVAKKSVGKVFPQIAGPSKRKCKSYC